MSIFLLSKLKWELCLNNENKITLQKKKNLYFFAAFSCTFPFLCVAGKARAQQKWLPSVVVSAAYSPPEPYLHPPPSPRKRKAFKPSSRSTKPIPTPPDSAPANSTTTTSSTASPPENTSPSSMIFSSTTSSSSELRDSLPVLSVCTGKQACWIMHAVCSTNCLT